MFRVVSRLGDLQLPHYGQLMLLTLLVLAGVECRHYTNAFTRDQRLQSAREREIRPASVLAFLPAKIRHSERTITAAKYVFFVSAVLWALQAGLPWSPWCAAIGFTAVMALHFENSNWLVHSTHVVNMLLILYAIWYQAFHKEIRASLRSGSFWTTPLYPRWAFVAGLAYVCIFYTNAGINKITFSGFSWANGTPLQLWAAAFGDMHSFAGNLVVSHRWVAAALQIITLVAETGAVLAIVFPRLRVLFGLALIGFHLGSMRLFGYRFEANAVILVLVLFPLNRWITQFAVRKSDASRAAPAVAGGIDPLKRALLARIDIFGRFAGGELAAAGPEIGYR